MNASRTASIWKRKALVENILFQTYGKIVAQIFDPRKKVDTPLEIFPADVQGSVSGMPASNPDHLIHHIHPNELWRTKETVAYLRQTLKQEHAERIRKGANQPEASANASFYLREFRKALADADETPLHNNPFYELTKLIFRHNLSGAKNLLEKNQAELLAQAPKHVPFFATCQEIYTKQGATFVARAMAILAKGLIGSKVSLVWTLSLLSMLCTGIASYHLLQPSTDVVTTTGWLSFLSHGTNPLLVGLLAGLLLTVPILDFKSRIYHGMAESGSVLRGIRYAFARHPKWLFMALLLTLLSIKSNYDGIKATLFNGTAVIQQAAQIQTNIHTVLIGDGSSLQGMDSLQSRMAQLDSWVAWITSIFYRIPKDEWNRAGAKAGRRQSPRYWSKYFIIHTST